MIGTKRYNEKTPLEKEKIRSKQNLDTYNKLFFVSAIFAIIGIVYLITDLLSNYYDHEYGYLDFTAVLLLMISSALLVLGLAFFKDKLLKPIQYIAAIYYFVINTVMLLFLTVDLLTDKPDFLICFFNYILINFVIYYNVILSLLCQLVTIAASLIVIGVFTKTSTFLNMEQAAIILVGTSLAQHYLRVVITKSYYNENALEQMSKEFEHSSTIDFLTKLGNRKALDMYINNEVTNTINNGNVVSISMMDIDDFKSYNDYYSHMTGDMCLRKIGYELNNLAKDKFRAFRYGGEEFVVIGLDCTSYEVEQMNNKILNGIRGLELDRSKARSVSTFITVSMGSALGRLESTDAFKDLLQVADNRLYLSKKAGKNRVTTKDD